MKILIIEGIATSGKSTLIEKISDLLDKSKVNVYGESRTHEPIMDNASDLHIEFFKSLLQEAVNTNAGLIIFDRFHFTQAFRAHANIDKYLEIEDSLSEQDTLVAYLQVDEDAIASRVRLATEHREESWGEYVRTKGKSLDEINEYYRNQQSNQLKLLQESKLEHRIFNTTNHEYKTIATQIINEWLGIK